MDPNEIAEMLRVGAGVSLMQGDIPDGDDEEAAELRNSLLAPADPQFVQDVAASLMREEWFEKKLKEKISYLLTKKNAATSTESGHEQARSVSKSQPLVGLASTEDGNGAQNKHSEKSQSEEESPHQIRNLSESPENVQKEITNDIITKRLFSVEAKIESGLVSMERMERKMNSEFVWKDDKLGEIAKPAQLQRELVTCSRSVTNNDLPSPSFQRARSVMRGSLSTMANRTWSDSMPEDAFSLMMIGGKPHKTSWRLGATSFTFQMTLCILILLGQITEGDKTLFNVPFQVDRAVTAGQFFCILFCVAVQSDVVTSIQTLTMLWKNPNWNENILRTDNSEDSFARNYGWIWHVFLPNIMKLVQGLLVTFVSFVIIVQSDNIIALIKDFTALIIISEFDNVVFQLALAGFFGEELQLEALRVKEIEFTEYRDESQLIAANSFQKVKKCNGFALRPICLAVIAAVVCGGWVYFVTQQIQGNIFKKRFPACAANHTFAKEHFGDGECYGGELNTLGCEFEYGDCSNFNIQYPLCRGEDLINVEETILHKDECNPLFANAACDYQNGVCCAADFTQDKAFGNKICVFEKGFGTNTESCEYDNGDCVDYNNNYCNADDDVCCPIEIFNRPSFGDGRFCNGGIAATKLCNYDDKDCTAFNLEFPRCPLEALSEIDGSGNVILGNDVCDSGIYNSNECGWEFGDCAVGQVGQDLQFFGGKASTEMSKDGSTLAVVSANSATPIGFFRYEIDKKMWIELSRDVEGKFNSGDSILQSIAMNSNSMRIVIGSPSKGLVRVFDVNHVNSTSLFTQVGDSIAGEEEGNNSGWRIDLIPDGSMLAFATPMFGNGLGQVRIFTLQTSSSVSQEKVWKKVGEIFGNEGETIGKDCLHLNARNGTPVLFISKTLLPPPVGLIQLQNIIIGCYYLNSASPSSINLVYFDEIQAESFRPVGGLPFVPFAVSDDGTRIAVLSNTTNPAVPATITILNYNPGSQKFDPTTNELDGSEVGAKFVRSVAISNDGNILAISSIKAGIFIGGSVAIYSYDRFTKNFRASIAKRGQSNTITAHDTLRDKSKFGLRVSVADGIDSGGGSSTRLSVGSYNSDTDTGYVQVLNLDEQFYLKCTGLDYPKLNGNGICEEQPPYNTEVCGWDGGDCIDIVLEPVDSYPGCMVNHKERIGTGQCDDYPPYNTEVCGWDGGDCEPHS